MASKDMRLMQVGQDVTVNNFVDSDTGELIDQNVEVKRTSIVVGGKDEFAWIYLKVLCAIDGLDMSCMKVLFWCAINSSYNTNLISLTLPFLNKISEDVGVKVGTIKNSISKMKKAKVLIALGSGVYRVNPRYFWRGTSNERLKTMRYVLEVECKNC